MRALCLLLLSLASPAFAQGPTPATPLKTAREQAPIDLTGYWMSIVTQDWLYRMRTPPKGDYGGVPLNKAAREIADAWDPAKDEASDALCKSYGAAGLMRIPQKLHITWADDNTLRIEAEAGSQTRLLHFRAPDSFDGEPTWQGDSVAEWEILRQRKPPHPEQKAPVGGLKVVTTHMRPGYLRRNGVPYSNQAVMTEHFDVATEPNGWRFILLTTEINDPEYLTSMFLLNTPFRLLPDGGPWNPGPCTSR
jgi:hypothetical protein